VAAAAGRDVAYPLLRAVAALPESQVRESLRRAVEHGVLVAVQASGSFRFRHALLAEAVYATILPGEREELHARLAQELARRSGATAAELAPHWAAAGRSAEALAASVEAARQAEAVFGLAEALAHLERARSRDMAQFHIWLCAKGLRAQAELAALARARRDADDLRDQLSRARTLLTAARRAADEAAPVTLNAAGWRALAEAEYQRARGVARPDLWADAADTWERLERPPLAAYCRWRQAEALVAAGASRAEASGPLRQAHAVAARIGAKPLARQLEQLAERARLEVAPPVAGSPDPKQGLELLGLTPRQAEVLALVARGYTNREIAATLVISVRTAGVHVSHILRKLGVPNRLEAAAIAHRLSPPHVGQAQLKA
jgi:DNA-binding CsgD family transcriptional regulator